MAGNHNSGRPRKSARLKQLEGDRSKVGRRKLERLLEREPKARGEPVVPTHLSEIEQAEFRHVLATAPAAILAAADQAAIENYAVAVCTARDAHAKIAVTGMLIQSKHGPVINPFWRVWRQSVELARALGSDLGMSPSARAKLEAEPPTESDPMALLLEGFGDDGALATRQ